MSSRFHDALTRLSQFRDHNLVEQTESGKNATLTWYRNKSRHVVIIISAIFYFLLGDKRELDIDIRLLLD